MGRFSGKLNTLSMFYMLGKTAWNVYKTATRPTLNAETQNIPYRPDEWAKYSADESELIYMAPNISESVVTATEESQASNPLMFSELSGTLSVGYFFDAFIRADHVSTSRITEHPVMDGSNISDHAYNLPDQLTLEILVSDVMDSVVANQFTDYDTKSVSAYWALRDLKIRRVPLSINTRFEWYNNMVIERMSTLEEAKLSKSLRCTVMFKEIISARAATFKLVSLKPEITDSTDSGAKSADPITDTSNKGTLVQVKERLTGTDGKKRRREDLVPRNRSEKIVAVPVP